MTTKRALSKNQLDDGKKLARELYDWSIRELESPDPTEWEQLPGKYPRLSKAQIEDVLR